MKRQDIGLLLKLYSLQKQEEKNQSNLSGESQSDAIISRYTARALEQETGISKSQINLSIRRCYDVGLARRDRRLGIPRVNTQVLFEFIVNGLKLVFPVKPMEITRGIATAFSAPVLKEKLMSAGELAMVWPDARGDTKGQSIEPLFKSVTFAIKQDPEMYALLALVDAVRVGQPREANLAIEMLKERLGLQDDDII